MYPSHLDLSQTVSPSSHITVPFCCCFGRVLLKHQMLMMVQKWRMAHAESLNGQLCTGPCV
jgi:hypothetical protein